jgi:hypothetical protein
MRLDIVSFEEKQKHNVEAVQAHEARGGDPRDPTYAKAKFFVREFEKERETMAVSKSGGRMRISEFHFRAIRKFCLQCMQPNSAKSVVTELAM